MDKKEQIMEQLTAVKGMRDILPPDSAAWEWLEDKVRNLMARYAYRNIRTPILEHTALFIRGIGEVTDIVEKEMYSFVDSLNGDQLTLRPENTAGVVRAVSAQKSSFLRDGPKRLFYIAPMFRHENVQRGRQRQFHQVGAEALGFHGPDVDVELILMAQALWKELGIEQHVKLQINTLGQPEERQKHREALVTYLEAHLDQLDEDAKRRLYSNPLRTLDTKNPAMQKLADEAPALLDYLGAESLAHFEAVKNLLDVNGVKWEINPRLVRGLDYYNLTVFEFVTDKLGAQGTVCGGGRYDYLFEMIGAKPTPAVGWALGMERLLELLLECNITTPIPTADAYVIISDYVVLHAALPAIEALRRLGVNIQMHASSDEGYARIKNQFKKADDSQAPYALIFGESEMTSKTVTIKTLQGEDAGKQWERSLADVESWYGELLKHRV